MKDLFRFNDELQDEERLSVTAAAEFVRDRVNPLIEDAFARGEFPVELIEDLAGAGFLGIMAEEKYGGSHASPLIYGLIMRELEKGDSGLRSFASVQNSLVVYPISAYGSSEQKEHWLPRLISGQAIGCFGLTEADHGSDPGSMNSRAVKVSGGYRISGSKMWITNGSLAQVCVLWARTEEGIRAFLVDTATKGFGRQPIKNKWSLRASDTAELYFDDMFVPEDALLPGTKGLKSALACLTKARFGIAWGTLGLAEACYDIAADYAARRIQFGKPIASFQLVQEKLAQFYTSIQQALFLSLKTARLMGTEQENPVQISLIKRSNTELARLAARTAREILGAAGISSEYPLMRYIMNMESVITYEGTSDIHTLILGKYLTGIQAFS